MCRECFLFKERTIRLIKMANKKKGVKKIIRILAADKIGDWTKLEILV